LSTLVLGLIACAALYVMLRDFEVPQRIALAGALTMAVNPAFVVLSASFMTDVPFTACATLSLLCYSRAARFGRPQHLWWAGFWAFAAFTVRQVGIVVPVAGVPLLLRRGQPRTIGPAAVSAALGFTWGSMAALWLILDALVGSTSIMTRWTDRLQHVLLVKPFSYLAYNLDTMVVLALFVLPASLAAAASRRIWRSRALAASAIVTPAILFGTFGELPLPLPPSETWNLREIGSSRSLISGSMTPEPDWMKLLARVAGGVALVLLLALLFQSFESLRRAVKGLSRTGLRDVLAAASAKAASPAVILLAFVAGYIGIINLLWMYNDRYYLTLIPAIVTLILAGLPVPSARPRLTWVAIAVFAAAALVGSRDAFRFNLAIQEGWQALVGAGVPPSDIDAGYAWNGWMLYAHPEHLAEGLTPQRDVPWVTSSGSSEYVLSKSPIDGYDVERAVAWTDLPWPGPDQLFVLRRRPDGEQK
jgi:4-amino-4-deoxy-L-arabinose transferase-like glycosyltransferase